MPKNAVVVQTVEQAQDMVQFVKDHVTVYSQDEANESKFHLHDNDTGEILTQVNSGASVDWNSLVDLR